MRRLKPLVLVLFAVFAVGAVMAASAFAKATPEITPIGLFTDNTAPGTEPALVGKGIFKKEAAVVCKDAPSTGGFQTSHLGTFDVLFLGCLVDEIELLLCTGLNDTQKSSILVLGTFHLRYQGPPHTTAVIAYLIIPVHFSCVGSLTTILIEVRGCAAGPVGPTNTEIKLPSFYQNTLKKVASAPENEPSVIENEAGTGTERCALESHEGTGAYSSSAETLVDNIYPLTATSEIIA
jgi:hypothetical protein